MHIQVWATFSILGFGPRTPRNVDNILGMNQGAPYALVTPLVGHTRGPYSILENIAPKTKRKPKQLQTYVPNSYLNPTCRKKQNRLTNKRNCNICRWFFWTFVL